MPDGKRHCAIVPTTDYNLPCGTFCLRKEGWGEAARLPREWRWRLATPRDQNRTI